MADSPINSDNTAAASASKMATGQIVGNTAQPVSSRPAPAKPLIGAGQLLAIGAGVKVLSSLFKKKKKPAAEVKIINGENNQDNRVKIQVPYDYRSSSFTQGSSIKQELLNLGGIIFPYTPSISYEHKADYSNVPVMHSNFAINFYQRSYITNISISGKFTVQNQYDAEVYLSTIHMLRALTKMRSGGEDNSGSPPPVCRLEAYGDFMLSNVPVAISSFKVDLPDNVDYYTTKDFPFNETSVPTISTISLTLVPMYSRAEMQKFTVTDWLTNANTRTGGYL
jgi:hypothetical protein